MTTACPSGGRFIGLIIILFYGENMGHRDGDDDKTKEEYDDDNRSDQLNPNNDEYQGDDE